MKILFISPNYVYPPVRGYEVMMCRHIEQLTTRHSIDIIAFGDSNNQDVATDPIIAMCNSVKLVSLLKWRMLLNLFLGLFSSDPLQVCLYRSSAMSEGVAELLRLKAYDVVIFQLSRMIQFLPKWYQGHTLLNMIDPLVLGYTRSLAWKPWYERIALGYEITRLSRYERQNVARFDKVTLIAQADVVDYGAFIENMNFQQLQYGIDTQHFSPNNAVARQPWMIVITGNMGYAPNIDAVKYFCREIFPLILEHVPMAQLWLVGVRPSAEVISFGKSENITVTGFVDDVRHYLLRAMVSVCPIRLNVGTQTKVLEALATGTPVVTTSAGNHGICAKPGSDLLVADTPSEMASHVVNLLRGENWEELSTNGRKFVQENFKWEKSAEKLEDILFDIVTPLQTSKLENELIRSDSSQ